jgi:hypothetical protein
MKVKVGQIWKIKKERNPIGLWPKVRINEVKGVEFSYINLKNNTESTGVSDQFSSFSECYNIFIIGNPNISRILYGN